MKLEDVQEFLDAAYEKARFSKKRTAER